MNKAISVVCGVVLIFSLAGCATLMGGGKSGTRFQTGVSNIYDAALDVLKDEDLPVVSKTLTTTMAKIDSEYPDGNTITIMAKATSPQYSETIITISGAGEDYRAFELMKKIESRVK